MTPKNKDIKIRLIDFCPQVTQNWQTSVQCPCMLPINTYLCMLLYIANTQLSAYVSSVMPIHSSVLVGMHVYCAVPTPSSASMWLVWSICMPLAIRSGQPCHFKLAQCTCKVLGGNNPTFARSEVQLQQVSMASGGHYLTWQRAMHFRHQ